MDWMDGMDEVESLILHTSKYPVAPTPAAKPLATPAPSSAGAMDNMPGMGEMTGIASEVMSLIQSISLQASSLGQIGQQNLQSIGSNINSQITVAQQYARTNSVINGILLPLTNFAEFRTDVQVAAASIQSLVNSEVSYASQELASIASVASSDINAAVQDIGRVLSSLYGFSQEAIEIILSNPLLTALPLLNPALLAVAAVAAADPVKLFTDYPAWQSEVASRQSVANANANSVYTLISTGLPKVENAALGLLSQLANIGNIVLNNQKLASNMRQHSASLLARPVSVAINKAYSSTALPLPKADLEAELMPQTWSAPLPTHHAF
ncbi:hypothetical protein LPJ73_003160 [Coemansia sp. RSA 2703]|nr:hypothetical protein LPJ73_003160 [Coemansia sp. RSA 2703]KAJ2376924.1 hypothetical protein IW150_001688 [Coemansia sp. RSA 2607]